MKKIALFSFLLFGCARPARVTIPSIERIIMRDADAFVLMARDQTDGALRPRKIYAEEVVIVFDVLPGTSPWAEYVDAPGELRGEGDRLILHVRSASDIE